MNTSWSRAIIVTPGFAGADGISTVTRAYVDAFASSIDCRIPRIDVWSLDGEPDPAGLAGGTGLRIADPESGVSFRSAGGRRVVFAGYGLGERHIDERTLVVVQHVHLAPAVLPLVARGAQLLLVMHGIEMWTRLRPLERLACRRAWKRVAGSAHTIARFRTANPDLAALPVEVCAPGLPSPVPADAADVPGLYALIVGRMDARERYKGHDELLEVWPSVCAHVPDATLIVAGGGDDRARLERKAASLDLHRAVRFEGVVDDARLQALYRNAAVFAMPSPNEGFGLVYVEALRAGVPCIVASGAAEEIVEHGRTGLVVPPRDRALLTHALVRLLSGRDERTRMKGAAVDASRRFTSEAFQARVAALVQYPGPAASTIEESHVAC